MGQHSALLWCSAAESRDLKGRPTSHQRDVSEHRPGRSSEGVEVCPDPCRRQFLALFPLCLTPFPPLTAVSNKKHREFLEKGLSVHQGTTCQALCSCKEEVVSACAALKPWQCSPAEAQTGPGSRRGLRCKADLFFGPALQHVLHLAVSYQVIIGKLLAPSKPNPPW